MLAFWPDVLKPLLEALAPRSIVEIGSESGKMTRRLLELARQSGATVHAVDPAPRFDVGACRVAFGRHFVFHRQPSLMALHAIDRFEAVLIDGDHNWYTVFHELGLLESRSAELGQPLPLVLVHDVGWPYGRRDLYYQPEVIPEAHRQPWSKGGLSLTEPGLLAEGGYNSHLCHAVREGGPRNGVLTAVEDYLAQTKHAFSFAKIPAAFGLGILLPEALARTKPELCRLVEAWTAPEVERFIERLEMARLAMMTGQAAERKG